MLKNIFVYFPTLIIIFFSIYLSVNLYSEDIQEKKESNNFTTNKLSLNRKINSEQLKDLDTAYAKIENTISDEIIINDLKLKKSDYEGVDNSFIERIQQIKNPQINKLLLDMYLLDKKTAINREQKILELNEFSQKLTGLTEEDSKELWSFLGEEVRNENFYFLKDFKTIYLMQNNQNKLEEFYSQNIPFIVFEEVAGPRTEFFMDGVNLIFQNKTNNETDEVLKNILLKVKSNAKLYYRVIHIYKENNPNKSDSDVLEMLRDEERNFPQPENTIKTDGPVKIK